MIADRLCNRLTFSMSRRDLDRITDQLGVPEAVAVRVRQTGLLIQRSDRVHFAHELFFDAFAAEAVIRTASGEAVPVIEALAHPQHASRRAFIIGAIDDDQLLYQVMERLQDSVSVASCLSGACGRTAQEWAESYLQRIWRRLRSEAMAIRFCVANQTQDGVAVDKTTLVSWSVVERAFIDVIPRLLQQARYLDEVLGVVRLLDLRMAEEGARLRELAGESNISFRSAIFESAYVRPASPGIGRICVQLHGGFPPHRLSRTVTRALINRLSDDGLTAGQLYLLLIIARRSDLPLRTMAHVIRSHWASAPYHLRLDLMDAVWMNGQFEEYDREVLIETIEGLPRPRNLFLSTAVVEALAKLGALEEYERDHIDVVRSQIGWALSGRPDADKCNSAYGIYAAQIDHPYSSAYSEAIAELSDDDRRALLMRASSGADDTSFCVNLVLIELAALGSSEIGKSFFRWTKLPSTDSFMPQQSLGVFVIAHIALARLGVSLPARQSAHSQAAKAMVACGETLYWCNRHDLGESARRCGYEARVQELVGELADSALHVIRQCEQQVIHHYMERMPGGPPVVRSISRRFPNEVLDICRRFLSATKDQVGYFQHYTDFDRSDDRRFAIGILGQYGNSADLRGLRRYAKDPEVGPAAIAAIRKIEERLA